MEISISLSHSCILSFFPFFFLLPSFSSRNQILPIKVKSPVFLSPVSFPILSPQRQQLSWVRVGPDVLDFFSAHARTHTYPPRIVVSHAVRGTPCNSSYVEHDVLQLPFLPLHIAFPRSISVDLVRGTANFFCKGPGSKYFGLCGPPQVSVTDSLLLLFCCCLLFFTTL